MLGFLMRTDSQGRAELVIIGEDGHMGRLTLETVIPLQRCKYAVRVLPQRLGGADSTGRWTLRHIHQRFRWASALTVVEVVICSGARSGARKL
jgi:hypothetical protein